MTKKFPQYAEKGLKVFMVMAELGEEGLSQMIEHQFAMGSYLLTRLRETGWTIENASPFPTFKMSLWQ